jgi:hypothetical protein
MYNRPMYMQEGGLAGSFGSSINPSFGSNGVLENIQEQVSNNGDVLKLIQNRNQGTNTALSTQNPSTPDFNNNSDGSSAIDNLINNDPRFPKPRPAELTAFNPRDPNPFMRPENMMSSPINASSDPFSGMTFEQAQVRRMQQDVKSPQEQAAIDAAIAGGSTGIFGANGVQGTINATAPIQGNEPLDPGRHPSFYAQPGSPMSMARGLELPNFPGMGDTPRSYGVQVSPNNLTNQPTNSGTDSFPSGMLQNEMFGNMGRLQNIQQFANGGLADMGRFGDNQMVHAQTGEMVVPQSILQENPQIGMGLNQALVNQGLDPQRQIVGSGAGSMNPMTGQQEFFDLGKILKTVAPIAIGAMLGPGAGAGIGSMFGAGSAAGSFLSNPFVGRAITGALTSKLGGAKTKDALMAGLLSGGIGALTGGMGSEGSIGSDATKQGALKAGQFSAKEIAANQLVPDAVSKTGTDLANQSIKGVSKGGGFLSSLGIGDDTIASKFLSSGLGQGLSAGLLMQLLSGGDEDEDQRTEFERRPFGYGGPGGKLGGITYANMGGEMGFPRRNGGIDPSEGSGRKDDVPAMLMAGEFVLTKDAVKGLGGGNQRKGIKRAYNMMDNLEARA